MCAGAPPQHPWLPRQRRPPSPSGDRCKTIPGPNQVGFRLQGPKRSVVEAAASNGFSHVSVPTLDRILATVSPPDHPQSFKLKWRKVQAILEAFEEAWGWSEVVVTSWPPALARQLPFERAWVRTRLVIEPPISRTSDTTRKSRDLLGPITDISRAISDLFRTCSREHVSQAGLLPKTRLRPGTSLCVIDASAFGHPLC